MEYSRETPGFCDDVPPPTSLRRSVEWQQQRCGGDRGCRNAGQVVAGYCAEGRPKRTAADTLLVARQVDVRPDRVGAEPGVAKTLVLQAGPDGTRLAAPPCAGPRSFRN